jgi:hypothetical protein
MPRSSKRCLPFRSSNQNFAHISHFSHVCQVTRPSHPPCFHHPNNIWWSVQVMKFLIMQSSPAFCHFLPLRPKHSHQQPAQTPSIYILLLVWQTKFHNHTRQQINL